MGGWRGYLCAEKVCLQIQTYSGEPDDCFGFPDLDTDLIEDYKTQNEVSVPINPKLDLGISLVSIADGNYLSNKECSLGEVCFCDPSNIGDYEVISRVGLNHQMNKALLYYEHRTPVLAGWGGWIYLVKGEDGKWEI